MSRETTIEIMSFSGIHRKHKQDHVKEANSDEWIGENQLETFSW